MTDLNKLINIYSNDRPLLGALQELQQRREAVDIQSAKKFLGNSQFKQLCHITSELFEVWCAWLKFKIKPSDNSRFELDCELTDVQISCQTMLEGANGLTKNELAFIRKSVEDKNHARKYYEPQQGSK